MIRVVSDAFIGLEKTFHEWLDKMLEITNEVKRILHPEGCVFINVGDTYFGSMSDANSLRDKRTLSAKNRGQTEGYPEQTVRTGKYYEPKSLCLIPERLVIRMRDEQGWIIRNIPIWSKSNSMPASVTDRFKNSYEWIIFAVKNPRYYFDLEAIKRPAKLSSLDRIKRGTKETVKSYYTYPENNPIVHQKEKLDLPLENVKEARSIECPSCGMLDRTLVEELKCRYCGKEFQYGDLLPLPAHSLSEKKQDNVPGKNAATYEGFNARWRETKNTNPAWKVLLEDKGPVEEIDLAGNRQPEGRAGFGAGKNIMRHVQQGLRKYMETERMADNQEKLFSEHQEELKETTYGEDPNNLSRTRAYFHTKGQEAYKKRGLIKGEANVSGEQHHPANINYSVIAEGRLYMGDDGRLYCAGCGKELEKHTHGPKAQYANYAVSPTSGVMVGGRLYKLCSITGANPGDVSEVEYGPEDLLYEWMMENLDSEPMDVFRIATQPFKQAHFAVYPEKLIRPLIRAAVPKMICSRCGFIRKRITKVKKSETKMAKGKMSVAGEDPSLLSPESGGHTGVLDKSERVYETIGWTKCKCEDNKWIPGICLDPFIGSGTVGVVALKEGVNFIGVDLKQEYKELAERRIYKSCVPLSKFIEPQS